MNLSYERRRLSDLTAALKLSKEVVARDSWSRDQLLEHQRERAAAAIRHAAEHSPLYRERLGERGGATKLEDVEPIDRTEMMERYDELVTDPRLKRDDLLTFVGSMTRDAFYLGEYRVMATSGSSGKKGVFVYDRPGWVGIMAQFLRQSSMTGVKPKLPRWRLGGVVGAAPSHMSRQCTSNLSIGVHRMRALPATLPLADIVAGLNEWQPDYMNVFPSAGGLLVEEAEAGRLRIAPKVVSTSSDFCSPGLTDRLIAAFGVTPFNMYATTEGLWGLDCDRHDGIHLFEDMTLVENVDENDQPVPPGEPGARLLVTNLSNGVQPIIRLRLPDVMTLDAEPCACGRPLIRARTIDGRSDDVLKLPGMRGTTVTVLPMEFAMVARDRDVREFQVVHSGRSILLRVVPREGAGEEVAQRLRVAVAQRLGELGADGVRVDAELHPKLPRTPGGKLQLVQAAGTATPAAAMCFAVST